MQGRVKIVILQMILFYFVCAPAFARPIALADTAEIPDQTQGTEFEGDIRYGITNVKGINMRKTPDAKATVVGKLPITGTAVRIFEETLDEKQILWYRIDVEDKRLEGYIRSDLIDEITVDEYTENTSKSKARPIASGVKPSSSSPVPKLQSVLGNHSAYAGTTTVWIENGIYHSDRACPKVENGDVATLQTAQVRGLAPCSLCWCYDCLFGEQ